MFTINIVKRMQDSANHILEVIIIVEAIIIGGVLIVWVSVFNDAPFRQAHHLVKSTTQMERKKAVIRVKSPQYITHMVMVHILATTTGHVKTAIGKIFIYIIGSITDPNHLRTNVV